MEKTAKIVVGIIFGLSILGNAAAFYRETTTAQLVADFNGYQRCVNEVNAQVAKQQEQAKQTQPTQNKDEPKK